MIQDRKISAVSSSETPDLAFSFWRKQLQSCRSSKEVTAVVCAYLARWTSGEIASLPPAIARVAARGSTQIAADAVLICAEAARAEKSAHSAKLREITLTFATAASHLRALQGRVEIIAIEDVGSQ